MNELYPITIIKDRYSGTYSEAKWLAFNMYPENVALLGVDRDDITCCKFWLDDAKRYVIGKGLTPNDALADLYSQTKHRL